MRGIRRKEKEIKNREELFSILKEAKYITIAMSHDDEPYLTTLSHGFDEENNCIYFHCAQEGKKVDILRLNNKIWGQALIDHGYVDGLCDHLYATIHFKGTVEFIDNIDEKRYALMVMIQQLENNPAQVAEEQITEKSLTRVGIGKITINAMSGKKSKDVLISM